MSDPAITVPVAVGHQFVIRSARFQSSDHESNKQKIQAPSGFSGGSGGGI